MYIMITLGILAIEFSGVLLITGIFYLIDRKKS